MEAFEEWVALVGPRDGALAVGALQFFREVYDAEGPVSRDRLRLRWKAREMELAEHAAALIGSDVRRTTQLNPELKALVWHENGAIAISYNRGFTTPAFFAIRAPEAVCEAADNLQTEVMHDLWTMWPMCPTHDVSLRPDPINAEATWNCRKFDHVVALIGSLGEPL